MIERLDELTFVRRAEALAWLLFDVDGVLTDGRLFYSGDGEQLKTFHVRDGMALRLAHRAGLKLGLLSGRRSRPIERRARDLEMESVVLGVGDKHAAFQSFLDANHIAASRIAYIGDDLPDLPVLDRVGLAFAPADAAPEVQARAHVVLDRRGGDACVREMIEKILRARGAWDDLVAHFLP